MFNAICRTFNLIPSHVSPAAGLLYEISVVENSPINLARTFWQHLIRNESAVVLERLEANGSVSWQQTRGELRQEAAQWMAALRAAGIGPGDRVAVSLGKSSGLVTAHLAILGVGAGVVPLNPALTARETEAVLQQAQVKLAITHRETIVRRKSEGKGLTDASSLAALGMT